MWAEAPSVDATTSHYPTSPSWTHLFGYSHSQPPFGTFLSLFLVRSSTHQKCVSFSRRLVSTLVKPPTSSETNLWVVASTDGASAHTAHFLSTTQMSCVLTTIYCKSSVAAGACPTESMEVAETNQTAHTGYQTSPGTELKTSVDYNTGLASKNNQ